MPHAALDILQDPAVLSFPERVPSLQANAHRESRVLEESEPKLMLLVSLIFTFNPS